MTIAVGTAFGSAGANWIRNSAATGGTASDAVEQITNGNFASNPISASQNTLQNGWQWSVVGGTSTVVYSGTTVVITGDGTNRAELDTSITTVIGTVYNLFFDATGAVVNVSVGNSVGSSIILSTNSAVGTGQSISFTATATTTWVGFGRASASASTIDNISCKKAGIAPTNWAVQNTANLSITVIGSGVSAGIPYVDFQFVGISGGTTLSFVSEGINVVPALSGQTWTVSGYFALVGGSLTNVLSVAHRVRSFTSIGGTVEASAGTPFTPTATLTRQSESVALANVTSVFVTAQLLVTLTAGLAVNFTLRYAAPQLEQASSAGSAIFTTGTADKGVSATSASKAIATGSAWARASTGTYLDATGQMQIAPVDTIRIDHAPAAPFAAVGTLAERASSNLYAFGNNRNLLPWVSNATLNSSGTTTDITGIYSSASVIKHARNTAQIDNNVVNATISSLAVGQKVTGSFWVYIPTNTNITQFILAVEGNCTILTSGFANMALRDQWQRIQATSILTGTVTNMVPRLTATTGDFVYTTCWQLEYFSPATSYIPTTGLIANRAFDISSAVAQQPINLLKSIVGVAASSAVGSLQSNISAMKSIVATGATGTLRIALTRVPPIIGVIGVGLVGFTVPKAVTTIYNYEGFDHETGASDLLTGIVSAFINCTGSLSTITPYSIGNSLAVRVIGTASSVAGHAIYNCGPATIARAGLGVMTQSSTYANQGTDVGFAFGNTTQLFCRMIGGNIFVYRGPTDTPTLLKTLINVVPATGWFFLELTALIAASGGQLLITVNGTQVANYTNINTSADGLSRFNGIVLGGISPVFSTTDFLFDDVYLATTNLGAVRVTTLLPTGNGSIAQFLSLGDNWQQVADPAMDGDASYNFSNTQSLRDQFTVAALPASATGVVALKITMAARKNTTNTIAMRTAATSLTASSYGVYTPLTTDYQYISDIYLTDAMLSTWTPTSIAAVQIGYGMLDATYLATHNVTALDFNFVTSTVLDGRITFARTSTATYFDTLGTLQSATTGTPRFDYGCRPNGTINWLLQSGALTTSPWSNHNSPTITASQLAPDNSTSAFLVAYPSGSNATYDVYQDLSAPLNQPGQIYTMSVYAKAAGNNWVHLKLSNVATSSGLEAWYDLSNSTLGTVGTSGSASAASATITSIGGGWYWLSLTGIVSATLGYSLEYILRTSTANNDNGGTANSGDGTYYWHPQVELSAKAGSYVATTTVPVNFGATPLGLLLEATRSNVIANPRCEGASAPSTAPTGWSADPASSGLTVAIVTTGSENGLSFVDVRWHGTASADDFIKCHFDTVHSFIASQNQVWTLSVYVKLVAGSLNGLSLPSLNLMETDLGNNTIQSLGNITLGAMSFGEDNSQAGQSNLPGNISFPSSAALVGQRQIASILLSNAATASISDPFFAFTVANTSVVDVTLRFAAPQLELGGSATSIILPTIGTPAVSTRQPESAYMTTFGSAYHQNAAGTIAADAIWNSVPTTNTYVWQITDDLNNEMRLNQNSQTAFLSSTAQGVLGIFGSLGNKPITSGTVFRHAATWSDTGSFTDAANSTLGGTVTGIALPQNINVLSIGGAHGGGSNVGAYLQRFRYWPRLMATSELLATVATQPMSALNFQTAAQSVLAACM